MQSVLLTLTSTHSHKAAETFSQVFTPKKPIQAIIISPDSYARAYSSGTNFTDYYVLRQTYFVGEGTYTLSYSKYSDYPGLTISLIVTATSVTLRHTSTASSWSGSSSYTTRVTVVTVNQ